MLASQLINTLRFKTRPVPDFSDFTVNLVSQDTREITPGSIFVAIKGFSVDGHKFVPTAVANGAQLIVAQEPVTTTVPVIYVNDTRRALAELGDAFYGRPSHQMQVVGVTGTNGKTTVTHMIDAIFRHHGEQTGLIGTMYRRIGQKKFPTANTTPDVLTLQKTLKQMVDSQVTTVAMEVSSIALIQGRVWGIDFDTAVFTNFTQDHLDYHKTMAEYAHAKSLLFAQLGNTYGSNGRPKVAVMNIDDPMGEKFQADTAAEVLTYGIKNHRAMVRAQNVKIHERGTDFDLIVFGEKHHLTVKTVGLFNVYNLLAAFGAGYVAGISTAELIATLEAFPGVKGRLQLITSASGVSAIVDYSHTPDGLLNALTTINDFAPRDVYCVIGCGGDRDRSKRPKMAKIAVENSDHVFFTSDNPRTEDPEAILDEVVAGVPAGYHYDRITDRRAAIQTAIHQAQAGDIVLIAGKGHEDYQIIGKTKHHFDDVEEATKALEIKEKK